MKITKNQMKITKNNLKTELASLSDANEIANLHYTQIKTGFLSSLGKKFLTILYKSLIKEQEGIVVILKNSDDDKTLGFVSGTSDLKKIYFKIILKNFPQLTISILPKLFDIKNIRKIAETFFYPKNLPKDIPESETLSLVINPKFQGQGLGKILFLEYAKILKKRGINMTRFVIGKDLINSHKMVKKFGAKKVCSINIHKEEESILYTYKIE